MFIRLSALFLLSLFLTACGSGGKSGGFVDKPDASEAKKENPVEVSKVIRLGALNGGTFTPSKLNLEFSSVPAFGTTGLAAFLVDESGNRYTEAVSVSFSSSCSKSFFANIISPVNAVNGSAESIYTANGCVGQDTITATATVEGKELSASAVVNVEAAVINSLRYISATPSSLGIKGFGQAEESTVQFKIIDREGRPVPNQTVDFSLNTAVGGITLYPATATSNEQGVVKTVVHSGSTATNVRVTASLNSNPTIQSTSEVLTISTGVSDQNSFSLSASILNPNAGNYDGVEVDISVWAADHFNNPVPDGTKVYFTTEGGQIEPECEISKGGCTVKWHSSNPRPCFGRATILATMIGEESFIDANGNGVLDKNEKFFDKNEAFRDDNEDGVYNELDEEFWDFNQNGKYDLVDGKYNGVLCKADEEDNQCSSDLKNIYVRESLTLVMAGDNPRLQVYVWDAAKNTYVETSKGSISVPLSGTQVLVAMSGALADVASRYNCVPAHEQEVISPLMVDGTILPLHPEDLAVSSIPSGYQPMPAGTKMTVSIEKGELAPKSPELILGSTSASSPSYLSFSIFPKDEEKVGAFTTLSINVETEGVTNAASKKKTLVLGVTYPEGGPVKEAPASAGAAL